MSTYFKALGDDSGVVHLFPFRTEKLSPPAQMVLGSMILGEYVVASFLKTLHPPVQGFFMLICLPTSTNASALLIRFLDSGMDLVRFQTLFSIPMKGFFFLLILALSPLWAVGQERDSTKRDRNPEKTENTDTLEKPVPPLPYSSPLIDTLIFDRVLKNTPLEYPQRPGLGNLGTDAYSLVPALSASSAIGFRIGYPDNPYAFPQEAPPAYDVRYPITRMEYSMGSQEEQFFQITHTQNVQPRWNLGVRYRKFGSPGLYRRQKSNFGNLALSTNYRDPTGRYQGFLAYQADRSRLQQNGGIQNPEVFEENLQNSRGAFRIQLPRALSRSRYDRIHLKQSFFPTGRSFQKGENSGLKLGLFHHGSVLDLSWSYQDPDPERLFYPGVFLDSSETMDRVGSQKLENKGGAILQDRSRKGVEQEFRAGIHHRSVKMKMNGEQETLQDGIAFLKGLWKEGKHLVRGEMAYGVLGYGKEDRSASLSWEHEKELEGIADSLGLHASYKKRRAAYLEENYRSNHFLWKKQLPKPRTLKLRARWGEPEEDEGFSFSHTRIQDAIFFGTDAMPSSAEEELSFFRSQLRQRFQWKKWGVDLYGVWQKELETDILRIPEVYLRGGVFYETPLFDRALRARFGARCTYYSAYRGYAYMPVTRRFYLQNEKRIGDYPFLDLYVHGKVGDILFFAELDHGNSGLMGYRYYGAPRYPLRDRTIRVGFKWNLFN